MSSKNFPIILIINQVLQALLFWLLLSSYRYTQSYVVFLIAFTSFQWLVSPFVLGFLRIGSFTKFYQIAFFVTIFVGSFLGSFLFGKLGFLATFGEELAFVVFYFLGIGYFLLNLIDLTLISKPELKPSLISKENIFGKVEIVVLTFILIFCFILYFLRPNQPYLTIYGLFLASFWQFINSFFRMKLRQNQKISNLWKIHFGLSFWNIFICFLALTNSNSFSWFLFLIFFIGLYLNYLRLLWLKITQN